MPQEGIFPAFRAPESVDAEYLRDLGNTKRFVELSQFDPQFVEALRRDPGGAVERAGLEADPEELRLLWDACARESLREQHAAGAPLPELPRALRRFSAYLKEKMEFAQNWMAN